MLLKDYILIIKKVIHIIETITKKKIENKPDGLWNGEPVINRKLKGIHFDQIYILNDFSEIICELGTIKINFKVSSKETTEIVHMLNMGYSNKTYVKYNLTLRELYSLEDINNYWNNVYYLD